MQEFRDLLPLSLVLELVEVVAEELVVIGNLKNCRKALVVEYKTEVVVEVLAVVVELVVVEEPEPEQEQHSVVAEKSLVEVEAQVVVLAAAAEHTG